MRHGDAGMRDLKKNSFNDRAATSLEAKKALLAKMKVKPTVTAPVAPDRAAIKAAELAELRAKREAERTEKRRIAAEADALRAEVEAFDNETRELEMRCQRPRSPTSVMQLLPDATTEMHAPYASRGGWCVRSGPDALRFPGTPCRHRSGTRPP